MEDFSLPEKHLQQLKLDIKYNHLFLKHLAQLHAASLAWEFKENVNMGQEFESAFNELQMTSKNEWYVTGIKVSIS